MAYKPHYLFAFGGTLLGGEVWECGVRSFPQGNQPVTGEPFPQAFMDEVAAELKNWYGGPASRCPQGAKLTWFKFNAIDASGHYLNKTHTNIADVLNADGPVQATVPAFLSLATSWVTARTRPPGAHGRIYLPNFGIPVAGLDPCIVDSAGMDLAVTQGKRLLDVVTMKQAMSVGGLPIQVGGFVPCVASKVDASLNIITGVSVGRVMDVQRRRKNAIEEQPRAIAYDWQAA